MNKSENNHERPCLLWHMEQIVNAAQGCMLKAEFFENNRHHFDSVSQILQINSFQVLLLSLIINQFDTEQIKPDQIASYLSCKKISLLSHSGDFDELERLKLVCCSRKDHTISYRVPKEVFLSIKQNRKFEPPELKKSSVQEVFQALYSIFTLRSEGELDYNSMTTELNDLIDSNLDFIFCKNIQKYKDLDVNYIILLYFCHLFINKNDDSVGLHELGEVVESLVKLSIMSSSFHYKTNALIVNKLIENNCDDGFEDRQYYRLTDTIKEELFSELNFAVSGKIRNVNIIKHSSVALKNLIFNPRESEQIATLTSLLMPDSFQNIQNRLAENNFRKGFASLFYGPPGTGKTESVYQIARSTGRDIFMVDISQIKSMWFGESEKKIKGIFKRYKSLVIKCDVVPILLFNEADAVIGKRKDLYSSSVAQTENAIQNIILQEMEDLDGIMIATTNLTQNLDNAFDRRFIYKIKFEKPSAKARGDIWKILMPSLCDADAEFLSGTFDFSGGQIENIARKCMVDTILSGVSPTLDEIANICRSENLEKGGGAGRIGF